MIQNNNMKLEEDVTGSDHIILNRCLNILPVNPPSNEEEVIAELVGSGSSINNFTYRYGENLIYSTSTK
jgi:hypothetical protein